MSCVARIGIGGVNFEVRSPLPLEFQSLEASRYATFVNCRTIAADGVDARVSIDIDEKPVCDGMPLIFDSREAWRMHARGPERCVVLHPPQNQDPLWSASFDLHGLEIAVWCNKRWALQEKLGVLINPVAYPLDLILVMYLLAERHGAILHAAGLALDGQGFVFPAVSGTGKSTLMRFFCSEPGVKFLSDDRIVVRHNDGFKAYGTPWLGDAEIGENNSAPLSGVLFLRRAVKNAIHPLSVTQAMESLLPVVSVPWYDRELVQPLLAFCEDLAATVPAFELQFKKDPSTVEMIREFAEELKTGRNISRKRTGQNGRFRKNAK